MGGKKILGALLLLGGIAALFYGTFNDPKQSHVLQPGNVAISALEK